MGRAERTSKIPERSARGDGAIEHTPEVGEEFDLVAGAQARFIASKLSELPDILKTIGCDPALGQPIEQALIAEAEPHTKSLVIALTETSEISCDYVGESEHLRSKVNLRRKAEIIGSTVFHDALARKDPLLAEELSQFYQEQRSGTSRSESETAALFARIKNFYEQGKYEIFSAIKPILGDAMDEKAQQASSHIAKGFFAPYFSLSAALPDTEGSGLFSRFKSIPSEYAVFSLKPNEVKPSDLRFIKSIVSSAIATENRAPESICNPNLNRIVSAQRDQRETLNLLLAWVETVPNISVADLTVLLQKMPRGVKWGRNGTLDTLVESGFEINSREDWSRDIEVEALDTSIAIKAIEKLNSPVGSEGADKLGEHLIAMLHQSRTYLQFSKDGRTAVESFFKNKLSDAVARVVFKAG